MWNSADTEMFTYAMLEQCKGFPAEKKVHLANIKNMMKKLLCMQTKISTF